ncbi:MAG: hypothetical protein HY080_08295 [Gammaproteobacteria bacterium]|nr:hypothetical protein [Gammaproteobacteria bacterium]
MLLKRSCLLACLGLLAGWVNADAINIELSNKSAHLVYASELYGSQYGPIDMEFSGYFDEDNNNMLTAGLLVRNDSLDNPVVISIGTRAYYADAGNAPGQTRAKAAALTIGGELLYFPNNLKGFGFGAKVFIAPRVVTFLDAQGFIEYGARAEYEITKQSSIYLGYSKVSIDLKTGSKTEIKQGFYVGIGMRF